MKTKKKKQKPIKTEKRTDKIRKTVLEKAGLKDSAFLKKHITFIGF